MNTVSAYRGYLAKESIELGSPQDPIEEFKELTKGIQNTDFLCPYFCYVLKHRECWIKALFNCLIINLIEKLNIGS